MPIAPVQKFVLLGCCLLFGASISLAQRTISGTVTDDTGEPLIGANILTLSAIDDMLIHTLTIVDRWGSTVYIGRDLRTSDPSTGWDGRSSGQWVAPGVYTWYATIKPTGGRDVMATGMIAFVR